MSTTECPIHVGVLLLDNHQYLDQAGPVDLMSNLINAWNANLPHKVPFELHYITTHCAGVPVRAASGPALIPTNTLDNCPTLQVLLIPGPEPEYVVSPKLKTFLEEKFKECCHILSVCTASIVLARAGLLKGKKATSNKTVLKGIASDPQKKEELCSWDVHWEKSGRWVRDGKIWTSAGITAGMDMVSAWLKASPKEGGLGVDEKLLTYVWEVSEWIPRPREPDPFACLLKDVDLSCGK
ncbi:class I glutamine amidotransferase-like protein [Kalaharituber pfeilii]|nr:class I glutamine amidotransferase-like protein [Kalaharituber pfeilii]